MVFEDLQWADAGLLDFIESLLEWSRTRPILVVTLSRPELIDRRPNWGAGQRNFVALHLEPLPDEAMAELVRGMVPGADETRSTRSSSAPRACRCTRSRRSGCSPTAASSAPARTPTSWSATSASCRSPRRCTR